MKKNKLLLDGGIIILEDYDTSIEVISSSTLYIVSSPQDLSLDIDLKDHTTLTICDFNTHNKNVNIIVHQHNNTRVDYHHTFKIDGEYKFNYQAQITGNNNINNINIYGVSNGFASLNVDGIVECHVKDNELNENIKILTMNGKAFVSPMLHVSSLNIIANHNTAISNVDPDSLFYLMSKGITYQSATSLIEDGYLYGLFKNTEFIKLIK